ncbi:MAG: glycine cleavage system protein GcvH [Dehalococcoidia bacterium]|nr:glycine cleavage system protein GcvH [Dehalococcoidia bacterium]MDZ4278808.1 glycine cleavage system protein GcvH [Dehalococcoidia bacterium]
MNVPADLRYTKEHEWVRDDGGVGITDYAQDQLGDIVYLDLPAAGTSLSQLEKMGEIESVKAVSDLFSPVSGEVLEVNQEAVDNPELVNSEPYGRGWLIKVRLGEPSELNSLLSPKAYEELVASEQEEEAG